MPVVTSLKPQKNKKHVNVYLDGKFAFGIDLDNLVKFGIKIEKNFTDEEIEKITHAAEFSKTYNRLLNFATLRPRSKKEINDWLRRKKVSKDLDEKLFEKLTHLNLVNDYEFAKWWVGQRLQFKSKSKRELQFELRKKGIDTKTIDEVLDEFEIDETKSIKDLINKNKWRWEKYDESQRRQKQTEFLARKGFGWEKIKQVVD